MNNKLNTNQYRAITAPMGPVMVIAGPGSGKTFVITRRVNYMIEHLKTLDRNILVITFTKAAAEEMKRRYQEEFGVNQVQFGTFHAIFYKILRMTDQQRYDLSHLMGDDKKKKIVESIYKNIEGDSYEDFVDVFLAHMTLMKNQLIQPQYYNPDGLSKEIYLEVYKAYENYKERHNLFDFDDMLVHCYHALTHNENLLAYVQNKYKHILIDEFQDINAVQFEIIKLISDKQKDLFVVGDDDQSIYQFRGSKPEFLLSFETYFDPVYKIVLDENYRSTKPILEYSNALINHNQTRYKKVMKTSKEEGSKPSIIACEDAKEQAQFIIKEILKLTKDKQDLNECAVIYRTNIQARPIVEALMAAHLPFILKDSVLTLYDQWITKDILCYLQLAQNMHQNDKIAQIINRPSRYISKSIIAESLGKEGLLLRNLLQSDLTSTRQKDSVQELIYHLQSLNKKDLQSSIKYIRHQIGYDKYLQEYASYRQIPFQNLQEVLLEIEESASGYAEVVTWEEQLKLMATGVKDKTHKQSGIVLSTMHSAKGLEFNHVFIIDVVDGVVPHRKSLGEKELEEERRLLYVAMTRAKNNLLIYVPKKRYQEKATKSPFIDELFYLPVVLEKDQYITHKHYGRGMVLDLHDTKARVKFEDGSTRVFDYTICLKQKLIFREDLRNE